MDEEQRQRLAREMRARFDSGALPSEIVATLALRGPILLMSIARAAFEELSLRDLKDAQGFSSGGVADAHAFDTWFIDLVSHPRRR